MNKFRSILAGMLVIMLLALAGCAEQAAVTTGDKAQTPAAGTAAQTGQNSTAQQVKMAVYLPTNDAKGVKAKVLEVGSAQYTPKHAVEVLLTESAKDQYSVFPKQLKVNAVTVTDGVAAVDMSKDFKQIAAGGTLTQHLALASIVNTLTDFTDIKGVTFSVEGQKLNTFGNFDLSTPLTRMDKLVIE